MLRIDAISYSIAGRPLLEEASVVIPTGHKVGIVGRNGTGKTTLFRLMRGELALDGGTISLPSKARVGGVSQEVPGNEVNLLDIDSSTNRDLQTGQTRLVMEIHTVEELVTIIDKLSQLPHVQDVRRIA